MRWRKSKPRPDITAPLEDEPAPPPPRFRWVRRVIGLCAILWVAMAGTWWTLYSIAGRRLTDEVAAVRARGEPLETKAFLSAPIPDSDNAVAYLRRAAETFNSSAAEEPDYSMAASAPSWEEMNTYPLTPGAMVKLRKLLTANRQALTLIRRARSAPGVDWGRFGGQYNVWGQNAGPLPEPYLMLNKVHEMAEMLRQGALLARADGDEAAMVEYLRDCEAIGRISRAGPSVVAHVLGTSEEGVAEDALIGLMLQPLTTAPRNATTTAPATEPSATIQVRASKAQIAGLMSDLLEETQRRAFARRAFMAERAALLEVLKGNGAPDDVFITPERPARVGGIVRWVLLPHERLHGAENFHSIGQAIESIGMEDWPSARRVAPALPAPPWRKVPAPPLTMWLRDSSVAPWYVEMDFRCRAQRRCAAVLLALRLYERDHGGKLPAKLDGLVPEYLPAVPTDPFTSPPAPVGYAATVNFPFVYSVWSNCRDDVAGGYMPTSKAHQDWRAVDLILFLDPAGAKAAEEAAAGKRRSSQ